jgi:hypothetical protein
MSELHLCAPSLDLCFQRGDTLPWTFTIKDSAGAAVNITGFSFLLTVDPSPEPTTSANNLFQLTGTITFPLSGIVQFEMSSVQADQVPGEYYFDLQMTDGAAKKRTVAKGKFVFEQDITKN